MTKLSSPSVTKLTWAASIWKCNDRSKNWYMAAKQNFVAPIDMNVNASYWKVRTRCCPESFKGPDADVDRRWRWKKNEILLFWSLPQYQIPPPLVNLSRLASLRGRIPKIEKKLSFLNCTNFKWNICDVMKQKGLKEFYYGAMLKSFMKTLMYLKRNRLVLFWVKI